MASRTDETTVLSTCPRDCYDSCGLRIVVSQGRIDRVTGDSANPDSRGSLCAKCSLAYNGVWLDQNARLTRPLRRVGAKGRGEFEPVSWEEALAEVAGRLGQLMDQGRAEDILTAHYTGTCSVIANQFPLRLLNAIGATEVEPDSICNLSGHVALGYLLGESAKGFDPRTARDAHCLLVWGANPSASGPHVHKHWLAEFPGTVVVIDPVRTPSAARADQHLRPYPGSDSALAFGLLAALRESGRLDPDFVAAHTLGFEEIEPLLQQWTPARAAAACGVAEADLRAVAAAYAAGPSMLWLGQALCRGPTGGNAFRAAALLPALTGNLGKPGTGIYFLNGKGPTRGLDMSYVSRPDLRPGPQRSISHLDLRRVLEEPPRDKALVLWNINIAASNPDQVRLHRALAAPELFTVAVDLFRTDSVRFADIVLPAASFMEFDDLVGSYFHLSLGPQVKAVEPPGEALANQAIFRRLARAMGLKQPELHEPDQAILEHLLRPLGLTFEELKHQGTIYPEAQPQVLWSDLAFPTPSGKIEIASAAAEARGDPRIPRPEPHPRPAEGWLRLLTPADEWHLNSSYDNEPRIFERTPETLTLHSRDAASRGLTSGDRARVWNETAELELVVQVDDRTLPGVGVAPKGRWPGRSARGLNINALNPGLRSDLGDSTAVHGVEVRVARAR